MMIMKMISLKKTLKAKSLAHAPILDQRHKGQSNLHNIKQKLMDLQFKRKKNFRKKSNLVKEILL